MFNGPKKWPNIISELTNLKAHFCGSTLVSGGSGKFSPTWKVGRNSHHLIRWSVPPLGKRVRGEKRSSTRALLLLLARSSRLASPRLVTTRARRGLRD